MVKLQKSNELYDLPDDLLYAPFVGEVGHVWARLDDDTVKIGITDYGQKLFSWSSLNLEKVFQI